MGVLGRASPRKTMTQITGKTTMQVILFDVNETLLDMSALDPQFKQAFAEQGVRPDWFHTMKENWFVSLLVGHYADFNEQAKAALQMVAERRDIELTDEQCSAILDGMKQLPPYPEVAAGLDRLRDAKFRLAALTNGTLSTAQAQLQNARLSDYFEAICSADEVQRLKPAREPYIMAAARLNVDVGEICMVAAHAWDLAGAAAAGCSTAFVARPAQVLNPLWPKPGLVGTDLVDLAEKLVLKQAGLSGITAD
jgi:2-haloacid dehalogenase